MDKPGCDLATDGFLNCPLSMATVGYLICPVKPGGGGRSKKGWANLDRHALRLAQEDEDILAVILASVNLIH